MAEQTGKNLPAVETKLNELVHRLKDAEAANLVSVILYGSAARGDFHPDHSDLNVLCVLNSLAVEELGRAAPVVRWWVAEQNQPAPLFFTAEELRQSADVFSIELKDMQDSRRVLFGVDPIADLHLPMNLHRIQLEHELRTAGVKAQVFGRPKHIYSIARKMRRKHVGFDALFDVREDVGRAVDYVPVLPHAPHAASRL